MFLLDIPDLKNYNVKIAFLVLDQGPHFTAREGWQWAWKHQIYVSCHTLSYQEAVGLME